MTFWFQRNNYANEQEMRRRFHHQPVVAQILKRQDMCLVSLNPTTLGLSLGKVTFKTTRAELFLRYLF